MQPCHIGLIEIPAQCIHDHDFIPNQTLRKKRRRTQQERRERKEVEYKWHGKDEDEEALQLRLVGENSARHSGCQELEIGKICCTLIRHYE
jgi:hypothetical protein